jgi:hypothetical protein
MILIGITGYAGSGKDVIADYLFKEYGFSNLGMSTALQDIARQQFGWDGKKDERGRCLLQNLGDAGRNYNKDFWINKLRDKINDFALFDTGSREVYPKMKPIHYKFAITGIRYPNEYEFVKSREGYIWKVQGRGGLKKTWNDSEAYIDTFEVDHTFYNDDNTTKAELYLQIKEVVERILIKHDNIGM